MSEVFNAHIQATYEAEVTKAAEVDNNNEESK